MLITLMSLLNLTGAAVAQTHVVPIEEEDKGGSGNAEERRRRIMQDDEDILFIISQWISSKN